MFGVRGTHSVKKVKPASLHTIRKKSQYKQYKAKATKKAGSMCETDATF